jgi:hypothetical protein
LQVEVRSHFEIYRLATRKWNSFILVQPTGSE